MSPSPKPGSSKTRNILDQNKEAVAKLYKEENAQLEKSGSVLYEEELRINRLTQMIKKAKEEQQEMIRAQEKEMKELEHTLQMTKSRTTKYKNKAENSKIAVDEWEVEASKWRGRLKKVKDRAEFCKEMAENLKVKLLVESENENEISGLRLAGLDKDNPASEFIIRMHNFSPKDWSFKGIIDVEPYFAELDEYKEECAKRNFDLIYAITKARSYWIRDFNSNGFETTASSSSRFSIQSSQSHSDDLFGD